ncbi:MAG: ABC transporter ATP-binding protein [Clostridia bacterium]|nr:ABC transporter ATP-binding protein [Clostridia bacterium]
MSLLEIKDLVTSFATEQGKVQAVRGISFSVEAGEIVGVVGESGSGKSQSMYSLMGLLSDNGTVESGSMVFDGREISPACFEGTHVEWEKYMEDIRGNTLSMIFQDPMSFLNPVLTVEKQLCEPLIYHKNIKNKAELHKMAVELLTQVGIPSPEDRLKQYPHQLSGGMRQRVIIAIALACGPKLIIADEPTTALDVTIQAKILELIKKQRDRLGSGVILITHDLGVVASTCDRVNIMYGGKIVETGTADEVFYNGMHPYTKGLLACVNNPEDEDRKLRPIPGSPPDLLAPPAGCPFVDRCEHAMKVCKLYPAPETQLSATHKVNCWLTEKGKI